MCRLNHSILGGVVSSLQNVRAASANTSRQGIADTQDRDWDRVLQLLSRLRGCAGKDSESLGCAVHCADNCAARRPPV